MHMQKSLPSFSHKELRFVMKWGCVPPNIIEDFDLEKKMNTLHYNYGFALLRTTSDDQLFCFFLMF